MFKRTFTAAFIVLSLLTIGSEAKASTQLSFSPLLINVKEGDTFSVDISAIPNGVKNYTVKASVKFPADLVTLKTWTYADNWMPLRQSGYDYFNNLSGVLIRTAGYPAGFSGQTAFGSAVFQAKKSGMGVIEFSSDSMALNENSINEYSGGNQLGVAVSPLGSAAVPASLTATTTPATTNAAISGKKLFDISLELDQYSVADIKDLGVHVDFYSFGNVPTPVDVTFDILDSQNNVVHSEKDSITVETENIDTKKFSGLHLNPGQYTLRVTTLYNKDVKDEFKQQFKIVSLEQPSYKPLIWPYLVVLGLILTLLILIFWEIKKSNDRDKFRDKWKK